MFTSIGNVIGPIIGGILFDIELNYPFYFAAIFLGCGTALTFAWKKPDLGNKPVSKGL